MKNLIVKSWNTQRKLFSKVKPNYDAVSETIDDVETGNAQSDIDTTDSMAGIYVCNW